MSPQSPARFQSWPKLSDMQKLFPADRVVQWQYDILLAALRKDGHITVDGAIWKWDPKIVGWQQTI
jgi:hypothetical protein